jgi:hypothetical protein
MTHRCPGVAGREERGDTGGDRGIGVDRPHPGGVGRDAESFPDMGAHLAGPSDEVVPVGGTEPDVRAAKDGVGVEVE